MAIEQISFWTLIVVLAVWSFVIKAVALWISARHKQKAWFVVIFVINTVGILELIYLGWFQKRSRYYKAKHKINRTKNKAKRKIKSVKR